MKFLITGSRGFIGRNIALRLSEISDVEVLSFNRDDSLDQLLQLLHQSDAIFHLAGEMRPLSIDSFLSSNVGLTKSICDGIRASQRKIPLIFSSSLQADTSNPYGVSKYQGEVMLEALSMDTGNPCVIYRLPHVFGKWCKPNYNSVIATFCHNIARGIPITINDPNAIIFPVHVDDVVNGFIDSILHPVDGLQFKKIAPEYLITVGELARIITSFRGKQNDLISEYVEPGLVEALYSTYLTYLPPREI